MSDQVLNWALVRARLEAKGRGAAFQLARALGMDHSQLYRKLKTDGELTERQAALVRAFLDDTAPPATAPAGARYPVFGAPADEEAERFLIAPGSELHTAELPAGFAAPGELVLVRVPGSQMAPRIYPGELVAARIGAPPAQGADALVVLRNGTGMIKTYRGRHGGRVFLGDTQGADRHIDAAEVRAVHAVVARF